MASCKGKVPETLLLRTWTPLGAVAFLYLTTNTSSIITTTTITITITMIDLVSVP